MKETSFKNKSKNRNRPYAIQRYTAAPYVPASPAESWPVLLPSNATALSYGPTQTSRETGPEETPP